MSSRYPLTNLYTDLLNLSEFFGWTWGWTGGLWPWHSGFAQVLRWHWEACQNASSVGRLSWTAGSRLFCTAMFFVVKSGTCMNMWYETLWELWVLFFGCLGGCYKIIHDEGTVRGLKCLTSSGTSIWHIPYLGMGQVIGDPPKWIVHTKNRLKWCENHHGV